MGQNQDKLEGGEEALGEGSEETSPIPDCGGAGSQTGDVMEGGSSCEEEAGSTGENSGEPDAQDLDESPGQEPTTPSSEKHINLRVSPFAAREVRQGGAAGKEGGGGGGEGGRTAPLVPQETDKNQKTSARIEERARAYKLYNQIRREEKRKTESERHTSSKIKMEYQDEGTAPHEESQDENFSAGVSDEKFGLAAASEDANSLGNKEEDAVMMKKRRCGAHAGSETLASVQQDQNDSIMADAADEDIELCAGTVGRLSKRKAPPTAQPLHPLKNSLQNESLSDMSPKQRTENAINEETLTWEARPVSNDSYSIKPKVTDTDDQGESVGPYLQMDTTDTTTTNQKNDSNLASNPAPPSEPSSILEKLLKRNRKETTPALSDIKEDEVTNMDTVDVTEKRITDSAAKELTTDKKLSVRDMKGLKEEPKENLADKHHHTDTADTADTADVLCSQLGVSGNNKCDSSLTNSHYPKADCQGSKKNPKEASMKKDVEIKPNMSASKNLHTGSSQSAVSHESASCEAGGVIAEESVPSSVPDAMSPPTKSDGQIADSCYLSTAETAKDISTVRPPLQIKSDSKSKADPQLSGSACSDAQPVRMRKKKVKDSTAAADTGSVKSEEVTADMKQDLCATLNTENMTPGQPDNKLVKESNGSVSQRDESQSTPKSRPVSELIKETIQLHEKLQHQERPKPAEVKSDEQGQSVKVAQMKAAFDSAQKSPDKAVERKPSMRREESVLPDEPQTLASTLIYTTEGGAKKK